MAELKRRAVLAGLASTAIAPAWAQAPGRHLTIVVGLAAGGGTDAVARVLQPKLQDALGQTVIVENRAGAAGLIAADYVARAGADANLLMLAPSGVIVSSFVIRKKMPFALKDLAPVALACTFPMLLVADAKLPVTSLAELVAYVKANPAKGNSSGSGSAFELQTALFSQRAGVPLQFVQYKSTTESVAAVMAGDVLMTFADAGPALAGIRGNRLRVLAVTSPERSPDFPDAPTMRELGYPELEAEYWMGLFAPARAPTAMVKRVETEMKKVLDLPDVRASLAAKLVEPHWSTGAEFGERIQSDIARWSSVRTAAGIAQID